MAYLKTLKCDSFEERISVVLILGLGILDTALYLNQLNIEPGQGAALSTSPVRALRGTLGEPPRDDAL